MKRIILFSIAIFFVVGCATVAAPQWHQSTLYFGLTQQDGSLISQQQWQEFVDTQITPRFPDGFTVLKGDGQWQDASGAIVREQSRVLIICHPADAETSQKIDQLRTIYKIQFNQESVLRTTIPTTVAF